MTLPEARRLPEDEATACFISGWSSDAMTARGAPADIHLSSVDPRLGILIAKVTAKSGPRRFKPSTALSHFDAIARSIIYQQLSKNAAATIYARYLDLFNGDPSPARVVAASSEALRLTGMSKSKVRYVKALGTAIESGALDLDQVALLPDDAILRALTALPGIGVWTAQMFQMFRLHRPDILPTGDLGIQRGLQLAYGLRKRAAPGFVARVGRRWIPYRSVACLYLWAAVDDGVDV